MRVDEEIGARFNLRSGWQGSCHPCIGHPCSVVADCQKAGPKNLGSCQFSEPQESTCPLRAGKKFYPKCCSVSK